MDTIYAEGQRRYVESLSSYARQFVGQMQKPQVDHIEGLSPAIAIEQKHAGHTPRSTVGTVTEIYDYLRIHRLAAGPAVLPGLRHADRHANRPTRSSTRSWHQPAGTKLYLMAPLEIDVGERYETLWEEIRAAGLRARCAIDGQTLLARPAAADRPPAEARRRGGDRPRDGPARRPQSRIAGSVENALALGRGVLHVAYPARRRARSPTGRSRSTASTSPATSAGGASSRCRRTISRSTVRLGWCPACEGLGVQTGTNPAALLRDPKLTLGPGRRRPVARRVEPAVRS